MISIIDYYYRHVRTAQLYTKSSSDHTELSCSLESIMQTDSLEMRRKNFQHKKK
jgi:hypothetical protein